MRRFLSTHAPFRAAATQRAKPRPPKSVYADSLILPKSTFPSFPPRDPETKERLLEKSSTKVYEWQESSLPDKDTFVLHDGPPYANGDLHMGHALNKFLKDLVLRTHIQRGRRVSYIPGWDCHGLPIELKALKLAPVLAKPDLPVRDIPVPGTPIRKTILGKPAPPSDNDAFGAGSDGRTDLGPVEVRAMAGELATETVELQKGKFNSWGIMGDWNRAYKTMDKDYELRQMEIFAEMVEKGLIYRQYKPIYWSPSSGTALAEAELEYNEKHLSASAFIRFPITELGKFEQDLKLNELPGFDKDRLSALVWTTTPWTIPANRALAVNSTLEYGVVHVEGHGHLIVAVDRIAALEKEMKLALGEKKLEVLTTFFGFQLEGAKFVNPLLGEHAVEQPILFGDFVSADSGTGVVHCAPGHGMEDYLLCQKNGIDPFSPVDDLGTYTADVLPFQVPVEERVKVVEDPEAEAVDDAEDAFVPILEGLDVLKVGNNAVLRMLRKNKVLVEMMPYTHKYPYDWRTKKPVIVRSTAQWFANVGDIKEQATEALKSIEFIPESGKTRLTNYVDARNEWCISRQRAWGVPIPVLYDAETGEPLLTSENVRFINRNVFRGSEEGSDIWWDESVPNSTFIGDESLKSRNWVRGKETMDVWFDSGSSWATLMNRIGKTENPVADMYLEGSDQHRGWFQSSLLTAIAASGAAPYRSVLTHGFVLDSHGRKMSKSIGNIIAPDDILSGRFFEFGNSNNKDKPKPRSPDLLRLWVASTTYTKDVQVGSNVLLSVSEMYRKLRTTVRYLVSNLVNWDGGEVPYNLRSPVDRYVLHQLRLLHQDLVSATDSYTFHKAIAALAAFSNSTLSAFYFVILRDPLYAEKPDAQIRASALATMFDILTIYLPTLVLYTPILAEEVYEHLGEKLKGHVVEYAKTLNPSLEADFSIAAHIPMRTSVPEIWDSPKLEADFKVILALDTAVKKVLEEARKDGHIKVSLEADGYLMPKNEAMRHLMKSYEPELAGIFNMSSFKVNDDVRAAREIVPGEGHWVFETTVMLNDTAATLFVRKARGVKCPRCWNYTMEPEHVDVCPRCRDVLRETGWRPGMIMGQ